MMKILPQRYREKMEDWFGKKGISGHVHCFFMPNMEGLKKVTYFIVLRSVHMIHFLDPIIFLSLFQLIEVLIRIINCFEFEQ